MMAGSHSIDGCQASLVWMAIGYGKDSLSDMYFYKRADYSKWSLISIETIILIFCLIIECNYFNIGIGKFSYPQLHLNSQVG